MAKEKLTPVPRRSTKRPATKPTASPEAQVPDVAPSLDHITESLRDKAVPVADIAFLVGNCLKHPEAQIEELKASLRVYGQVEPLIVNRRPTPAVVIGGNGRLQAALSLGWSHVAVTFVDLPDDKANALAVVLNRSQEGSQWDNEALDAMMRNMNTGNDPVLDAMMADLAKDQGLVPAEDPEPANQRGPSDTAATFKVEVVCPNADAQETLRARLVAEGFECKSITS